ncbi:hypothetical protein [uncultured Cohaesibacter sp.]|uniref:hypothetical protein n=1 Tax=uncultured Cohaesibacter sp. TaxID=1002546 RepID=UPI0029C8B64A|nr:hypothetical protein [uncultured Cohaesibacter sp.]
MSFTQTPFMVPEYLQEELLVSPFQTVFNEFQIGFSDENAKIAISQSKKEGNLVSPPDHAFVFNVNIQDLADSQWISIEKKLDISKFKLGKRFTVLISIKSSLREVFDIDLRLNRGDGSFKDTRLGTLVPDGKKAYYQDTFSTKIEKFAEGEFNSAKLLILAPKKDDYVFSLSMLNIFLDLDVM